jgi:poly-gamma-glutamate system protein
MSARCFFPSLGRVRLPWRSGRFTAGAVALGLLATLAAGALPLAAPTPPLPPAVEAAARQAEAELRAAEDFLWREKRAAGLTPAAARDPWRTGLIGAELTPLTTTLGNLSAKRTATDPRWAGELVRQMWRAGIRPGSLVAASFSGSFPGLNLAVALACRNLGAELGAVSSVTASTWGANQPGFTWPELEARLARAGLLRPVSLAVTAGGDGDRAADLEPEGQRLAERLGRQAAAELGACYLKPASFAASVRERLTLYHIWAGGRRIALYVNVGGTEASLGRSLTVLHRRSGFLPAVPFDFSPERGVLARLAEEGVPVLNLLNVRDLALRWGVPLDE